MYVKRLLNDALGKAVKSFPAVLVTGPRQSGKTTLLRQEFRNKDVGYVSFDDPLERDFARQDPNGFLNRFAQHPVILDEIQYVPELLPYLKMLIDQDRQENGRWLLTGSQQFQLMHNISSNH
jgi:predicted AAA+ superfamily ATPase